MQEGVYYTRVERLDNHQVESWDLYFTLPVDWHFQSGDSAHRFFDPDFVYERLFAPFEIFPGVILPEGQYRFTRWRLHAMTAPKRRVELNAQWSFGPYWSGHGDEVQLGVTFKAPPRLVLIVSSNETFARLPEGNFVAKILSGQINYAVSPFFTFANLVQYDNVSRNLGWQTRIRRTLQPGNDLFLVVSRGWVRDADDQLNGRHGFRTEETKVSAKFQYSVRF